ncbi:MAG: MarR family transcriptional regulator [Xanthomonadaceae bacterium]|nr:MarR family transcriptional regulator [Xanthomonadaceae bacterium]MBH2008106.1 MarR family transcriptional regulator [Xanthomonadaceae bacterium]
MTEIYKPSAGSLPSQVVWFFTNNHDEQLSLGEITVKFDVPRGNIHTQLGRAIDAKLLARTRNEDGEYIYSAGPAIYHPAKKAVPDAPAPAPPDAPRKTRGPVKGFASPRYSLDISQLKVEEGIPFMKINGPTVSKWEPVFQKLQKPDQSIALPGHLRGALASAVRTRNKENKGTYRVAMTGPGQARIWRLA